MSCSYPLVFRQRAVDAYERGDGSMRQIAALFGISSSTLNSWVQLQRIYGSPEALPDSGGRYHQKLFEHHEQALIGWLEQEPDLLLRELAEKLEQEFELRIDPSHISRVLTRLGYTRKKSP